MLSNIEAVKSQQIPHDIIRINVIITKYKRWQHLHEIEIDAFKRRSISLTLDNVYNVIRQLKYLPYNLVEVAAYQPNTSHPVVLKLYPLNSNDLGGRYAKSKSKEQQLPFPTMFWMCCPDLHAQIASFEDAGYIQIFQKKLLNSPESSEWLALMENAHKCYAEERWNTLSAKDQEDVSKHGWVTALRDVGVAGIRDYSFVKCLHCHYAHYLARPEHNNVLGAWVHELVVNRSTSINGSNDTEERNTANEVIAQDSIE